MEIPKITRSLFNQAIFTLFFAITLNSSFSANKFEGGYNIGLEATIHNGVLISRSLESRIHKKEIKNQLKYIVGLLNEGRSVIDYTRLKISNITATASTKYPGFQDISYQAKVFVSWNSDYPVPNELILTLPSRGDDEGRTIFLNRYSEICRKKRIPSPMSLLNFWYRFRIYKDGCPLQQATPEQAGVVFRFPITFEVSPKNSVNKYPEYGKIWEDNKLVAVLSFGKSKSTNPGHQDSGVKGYNEFFWRLKDRFGEPESINRIFIGNPGEENDYLQMTFKHPLGQIIIHMFLVQDMKYPTFEYKEKFNSLTADADFVSYSGHAGLGGSVRRFAELGVFRPNQYQVYFFNGCTSFAYVNNELNERHAAVNPPYKASKHLDIILNTTASFFSQNAEANMAIIIALSAKTDTYRTILQTIDHRQRAVVIGEEDNKWPGAFFSSLIP